MRYLYFVRGIALIITLYAVFSPASGDEIIIFIEEENTGQSSEQSLIEWEGRISLEKLTEIFNLEPIFDFNQAKIYLISKDSAMVLGYQMEEVLVNDKIFSLKPVPVFHDGILFVPVKLIDLVVTFLLQKNIQWEKENKVCYVSTKKDKTVAEVYGVRDLDIEDWLKRTIFIDPGHGGVDSGAVGKSGLMEKDVALDLALALKETLVSKLGMKAITSRDVDIKIPLIRRIEMANNLKAGCFISIHCGYSNYPTIYGFEIAYYPAKKPEKGAKVELWDNNQADYSEGSKMLAYSLAYALEETFKGTPVRVVPARAALLSGALMPAVIIEVGYLSNAADEANLLNQKHKDLIIEALFKGIYSFKKDYEEYLKGNL